ncbi:hypothetical protein EJB05_34332 [Eragrostis curvula]|uniref:Uncharacterized protein n=1 Tax=Eragrostis curvula TaxID=38414 RepID=A0A5J9U3U0_9POAL|nr:hypothetical protein EJB05_34332 [Eragrostis curvula]
MAMEPLPLFVGDGTDAALFSTLWSFQDDLQQQQQQQESVAELKQSLVATTLELDAAKDELKKKEQSIAKLADLVRQVAKERDDARDQLQHLLLAATATSAPAPPRVTSSVTDSDCSLVSSPVDPFFDPVTSADKRHHRKPSPAATPPTPPPPAARQPPSSSSASLAGAADAVLDMLASKRPLPQKGRLLSAVMEAGPLLQNLLVAGQLPRWRNPPTVHAPDALALGARAAGYVAAPMAGGGAHLPAAALGFGGGANACMKRPVSMLPLTPMAAANCSPAFVAKRVRLH